jgi:hypothetical protein
MKNVRQVGWVFGVWLAMAQSVLSEVGQPPKEPNRAVANAQRCLETIRGDDYRTGLTRIWVAENLAALADGEGAFQVLKASAPNYVIPYGCVESALELLGQGRTAEVEPLLDLGIELLPVAAGLGEDEIQLQTIKIATVMELPGLVERAMPKAQEPREKLEKSVELFRQHWRPSLWNRLLDRFFPGRQWRDLKKNADRGEVAAWNQQRVSDAFSALLFIKASQARVRAGKTYPSDWITFAAAGVKATTLNTRPIAIQAGLASLAALEGKKETALALAKDGLAMMDGWAPQMVGLYAPLRDLSVLAPSLVQPGESLEFFQTKVAQRAELALQGLDPYEQMLRLPLVAESFHALGQPEEARRIWRTATALCAKNENPEGQSIGLTRIWMSYARANCWPDKETEGVLAGIEKKLPEEYAKINF